MLSRVPNDAMAPRAFKRQLSSKAWREVRVDNRQQLFVNQFDLVSSTPRIEGLEDLGH